MSKTLAEWEEHYRQKCEEPTPPDGYHLHFDPNKGFFYWKIRTDVIPEERLLVIDHTATNDQRHFHGMWRRMAKEYQCDAIATMTKRNPKPFVKMFDCCLDLKRSGYGANGNWYWAMIEYV